MRSQRLLSGTAVIVSAVVIAACGSGDDGDPVSSSKAATSAAGLSAEAQQAVDKAYEGSFGTPPTSSPKPQPGKNIWLVTLSASFGVPDQIVHAAKLLGWHVNVFDGKYVPDTVVSGLRQAVADKADGIILAYADCADIKAGLQDVDAAGIPVVNIESSDCDQDIGKDGVVGKTGQPGLFDSGVGYNDPADAGKTLTFADFYKIFARNQALGLIAGTKGAAKIIVLSESDIRLNFVGLASFKTTLEKYCPDCRIVDTVDFVGADFGSALQQKVSQALVQHPEANALYGGYDAPTQAAAPAVVASGRKDFFVMGGEGSVPIVDSIHESRGVSAGSGFSVSWEGWAALDAMNHLLHGEKTPGAGFPSGIGTQLFDKTHNLPPKGQRFNGPIDFEAAYRKAWGVTEG